MTQRAVSARAVVNTTTTLRHLFLEAHITSCDKGDQYLPGRPSFLESNGSIL